MVGLAKLLTLSDYVSHVKSFCIFYYSALAKINLLPRDMIFSGMKNVPFLGKKKLLFIFGQMALELVSDFGFGHLAMVPIFLPEGGTNDIINFT